VSAHVFVDEIKLRGYPLHMKDENDQRRRSIATAIAVSGVNATIYDAGQRYQNERKRRAACLRALIIDAAQRGDAMLGLA
jgi:hypothetical protein